MELPVGAKASGTCKYVFEIQDYVGFSGFAFCSPLNLVFHFKLFSFHRVVPDPKKDDPTPKQRITLNWSENDKKGVRN